MTNRALDALRAQALTLSEHERADLAFELVASLDGPPDTNVAEAWDREILSRLADIEAGTAELIDREEFSRRLRAESDQT